MNIKVERKCEAIYGDSKCAKKANKRVISRGLVYNLCDDCADIAKKQDKLNHR